MAKRKRTYTDEQKAAQAVRAAANYQRKKLSMTAAQRAHDTERQRQWKQANPEKVRGYQLKHQPRSYAKKYGVPVEALAALFKAQEGKCGVCSKVLAPWPDVRTHVDHDHATGEVRGFLCSACNRYEGWSRRYAEKLRQYLETPPARAVLGLA